MKNSVKDVETFNKNISTFRETSNNETGNNIFIDNDFKCINFDNVKEEYSKDIKKYYPERINIDDPYSVDALVVSDSGYYFIEFKDAVIDSKQKKTIISKGKDSIVMFSDIVDSAVKNSRKESEFILVYNKEKNERELNNKSRIKIAKSFLQEKGKEELVLFGVNKLRGMYYKDVHTFDKDEFIEFLSKNNISYVE